MLFLQGEDVGAPGPDDSGLPGAHPRAPRPPGGEGRRADTQDHGGARRVRMDFFYETFFLFNC